jgi:hypothetical protein
MAHVLVYLQRSPRGLHPASAIAACVGRDLGSTRGASVFGLCPGDAGAFDDRVVAAAARAGIDQVVFVGPTGVRSLADRLHPRHVLVPWTAEAAASLSVAGLQPAVPRWVGGPIAELSELSPVAGVVAGTLPWHAQPGPIDAEFEGQVDQAQLPAWLAPGAPDPGVRGGLYFVAPQDLGADVRGLLEHLGARPVAPDYANAHDHGTLLWLDAGPAGLPPVLERRPPGAQVIAFPGPIGDIHPTWSLADWVLPGPWDQAVRELAAEHWKAALA